MNKFLVRLRKWEYWPFSVLYFPVFFYFVWLVIKRRSVFFFTSSNPGIDFGGMIGEKKSEIFDIIPDRYIPETHLVKRGDLEKAREISSSMSFPFIAKPNVGERGAWVSKIHSPEELESYVGSCPVDFLMQSLVDYPIELGVFYVRFPEEEQGRVTSIVRKQFLTVKGDGETSIMDLLRKNERALLTANLESDFLKVHGNEIPREGEVRLIEPIGNHCRGTQFLNAAHEIDEALSTAIDSLAKQIPGFYFGRFDLKCRSYAELRNLKHFSILELNGAGAEPGHIYQPGYSLFQAYKDIFWHLKVLAEISAQNRRRGVRYWSFSRGYKKWKEHGQHNKLLANS